MRLVITPLAEQDIESIGDYIARDNPRRALSFIRELRTRRPDLPIIAISGHLGPQRLDPAVLQAIQTLLPKPFDSAQLLAALARLPAPVRPDRPMAGAPD